MKLKNWISLVFAIAFFSHYWLMSNWISGLFAFACVAISSGLLPQIKASSDGVQIEAIIKEAENKLEESNHLLAVMAEVAALTAHGSSCYGGMPKFHKMKINEFLSQNGEFHFEEKLDQISVIYGKHIEQTRKNEGENQ